MTYQVLSPDGFPIGHDAYTSRAKAVKALREWVKRYEAQGYYSDASRSRIPLKDLASECYVMNVCDHGQVNECEECGEDTECSLERYCPEHAYLEHNKDTN